MSYTAEVATQTQAQDEYELFTTESAEKAAGGTVEVKKSLGRFRKDQLTSQKKSLQSQIDEIDKKIAAIDALAA